MMEQVIERAERRKRIVSLDDVAGRPLSPAERAGYHAAVRSGPGFRAGPGFRDGIDGSLVGPTDPLTIVSSLTCQCFVSGDLGITTATGVSAWADQTAFAQDFSQATGSLQPVHNASGLNGRGTVQFDGTNDNLLGLINLPGPAITNTWFFGVLRLDGWTVGRCLYGTSVSGFTLRCFTTSPNVAAAQGIQGPDNNGAALGSWVRMQSFFANTVNDSLKLGSVSCTGTILGNSNPAATFRLGGGSLTTTLACSFGCFGIWYGGEPTSGEKAALDTWVTAYYGSGVGV